MKSKHLLFYLTLYGLTILVAIFSLSINIKTVPINKKINQLHQELRELRQDNQDLQYAYLKATQLSIVEEKAKRELNMIFPKKTEFIYLRHKEGKPH